MDAVFKQKLLGLRTPPVPQSFSEALFGTPEWVKKTVSPKETTLVKESFSEKVQVIESFERFAEEKTSEINSNTLKIEGGEVIVRTQTSWDEVPVYHSQEDLFKGLKLDLKLKEIILKDKVPESVKVIFVSEKFRSLEEILPELKEGFINELIVGFPLKTAELFERMITAMKLSPFEVVVFPVEGEDEADYSQDALSVASYMRPEVIITLGAKATHKILKSNDRLSVIHGQFFTRKVGLSSFQIVPLFHPSIIETNQNMKKTAWADMQKIMKHLKKLP